MQNDNIFTAAVIKVAVISAVLSLFLYGSALDWWSCAEWFLCSFPTCKWDGYLVITGDGVEAYHIVLALTPSTNRNLTNVQYDDNMIT